MEDHHVKPTNSRVRVFVFLMVLLCAGIILAIEINRSRERILRFGFIVALSGDVAWLGNEHRNAVTLAVEEINAHGGINGKRVEVIYEDGKCRAQDAASSAQRLENQVSVNVIFGGTCSSETLAVAPITELSGVILFTSWSLSSDISRIGEFVFRNVPSDAAAAEGTAQLAASNGVRIVAIVSEETEYTQAFQKDFTAQFQTPGGEIVASESYVSGTKDFRTLVAKLISNHPDAILLNAQGKNTGLIAKQLKEQGFQKALYGNVYFSDEVALDEFGSLLEGGYLSEPPTLDPVRPGVARFVELYEQRFGVKPRDVFWTAATHDSVHLLAQAIGDVGEDTEKVRDYLHALKMYTGLIGEYRFDSHGDVVGIPVVHKRIVNGRVLTLPQLGT